MRLRSLMRRALAVRCRLGTTLLGLAVASCSPAPSSPAGSAKGVLDLPAGLRWAPASRDDGASCVDLGPVRMCWGGRADAAHCAGGRCVTERPVPDGPAPASGWRCFGALAARACMPRYPAGSDFRCSTPDACIQEYPRMPDDGEWECADLHGVVVCRRGIAAAGVVAGPRDPGWRCGLRPDGEPLCVDYAPDLPFGDTRGWSCLYLRGDGVQRLCERAPDAALVGALCAVGCPEGTDCVGDHCAPRPPGGPCWWDEDCGATGQRCLFGACSEGP